LLCVGLYALLVKRTLMKVIIGIALIGYAANLFFVLAGYRASGTLPIAEHGLTAAHFVNPVAQALVLCTIMVGLSLTLLLTALAVRLYRAYGTMDSDKIRALKG
jgi:multicomponent Na+:H+ antiporter subunit C